MAEELVYNENLIIQFSTADFQAYALNDDEEVETKHFQSLDAAKRWIDNKTAKKNEDNNRNGEIHLEYHCR